MRKRNVFIAALASGALALGAGGAALATLTASATASTSESVTQTTAAPQTAAAPLGQTAIKEIALGFAAKMGDSHPTGLEYVQGGRRQIVQAFSDDEVPNSTEVDAIVMRGQFIAKNAPMPPGASSPSGTVLIVVINATTGEMTDFGIQQQPPNLNAFGPVHISG